MSTCTKDKRIIMNNWIRGKVICFPLNRRKFIQYYYYRDKTWNSYLKVKSNITCPVKVGHPLGPREPSPPGPRRHAPRPLPGAVSLPPRDCPPSPYQPYIHCAAIYFFLCANRKVIYLNFLTNSHRNFILLYYL